jgi:hypothetical protein
MMERLLPALDANDEDKLFAALSFYTSVFSSCVALVGLESAERMQEGTLDVGIDLVAFVREFLQRLFAAVDTLRSGKEGAGAVDEDTCALSLAAFLLSYCFVSWLYVWLILRGFHSAAFFVGLPPKFDLKGRLGSMHPKRCYV